MTYEQSGFSQHYRVSSIVYYTYLTGISAVQVNFRLGLSWKVLFSHRLLLFVLEVELKKLNSNVPSVLSKRTALVVTAVWSSYSLVQYLL